MNSFNYTVNLDYFRRVFLFFLTQDINCDRRKTFFNQQIFDPKEGYACFSGTDIDMVMEKFEKAAKAIKVYVESDKLESDPDYQELIKAIDGGGI